MMKIRRICALAFLVLVLFVTAAYAFTYIFGDTLYANLTNAMPAKGGSYVDPNTGITVTRVTAVVADGNPGSSFGISMNYSTFNPLSSDGNNLIVQGLATLTSGGNFLIYDANTFAFKQVLSIPFNNGQDPEPRWDTTGSFPNRIYYRSNLQIRIFDIGTQTDTLLKDFNGHPGLASLGSLAGFYIYTGQKGSPSIDDRYWAYLLCSQAGTGGCTTGWAFTWDRNTDTILGILDLRGTGCTPPSGMGTQCNTAGVHDLMLSPWGDWVNIGTGFIDNVGGPYDGTQIWNMAFTTRRKVCYGNNPHDMWQLDRQGNHVFVSVSGDFDMAQFLVPSTGTIYHVFCQGNVTVPCSGTTHYLGYNNNTLHAFTNKAGWGFISTYDNGRCTGGPNVPPGCNTEAVRWANNWLFAIELDETRYLSTRSAWNAAVVAAPGGTPVPRVWRIADLQNMIGDSTTYYFQQPNAQMDYNGTYIWWGSNWRDKAGRMDVLRATLPTTWVADLSGTSNPVAPVPGMFASTGVIKRVTGDAKF
jgi:hypothetical protein